MSSTLHFAQLRERLHATANALDLELASRARELKGGDPLQLIVANSLWVQHEFALLDSFLDTLGANYGADMRTVDFLRATEVARLQDCRYLACLPSPALPSVSPFRTSPIFSSSSLELKGFFKKCFAPCF